MDTKALVRRLQSTVEQLEVRVAKLERGGVGPKETKPTGPGVVKTNDTGAGDDDHGDSGPGEGPGGHP